MDAAGGASVQNIATEHALSQGLYVPGRCEVIVCVVSNWQRRPTIFRLFFHDRATNIQKRFRTHMDANAVL